MRARAGNRTIPMAMLAAAGAVIAGLLLGSLPAGAAGASDAPGRGFLPDNRAWEMVSPPDKNGGDVSILPSRTRVNDDGSKIGFVSLAPFADAVGSGIGTDYVADRGAGGWATHAITPNVKSIPAPFFTADTAYQDAFSEDFGKGLLMYWTALPGDDLVANVPNLYIRQDIDTPGPGSYQLVTRCPRCESLDTPLPPLPIGADPSQPTVAMMAAARPMPVGVSSDLSHVAFESRQRLTTDAVACTPNPTVVNCSNLYLSVGGDLALASYVPPGNEVQCGEQGHPCYPVTPAYGGAGPGQASNSAAVPAYKPHALSRDGSRLVFTVPAAPTNPAEAAGRIFLRIAGTAAGARTLRVNASERSPSAPEQPAYYLDATPDGRYVLFGSNEQLTDTPGDGLYLFDADAQAGDRLTLLSVDSEPGDDRNPNHPFNLNSGGTRSGIYPGVIGMTDQGGVVSVYFTADSQLVAGEHQFGPVERAIGIYLWRDGQLRYLGKQGPNQGSATTGADTSDNTIHPRAATVSDFPRHAQITPDGRYALLRLHSGDGILSEFGQQDANHGGCFSGSGCRQLYLYDAQDDSMVCISCRPDGTPSHSSAGIQAVNEDRGGSWPIARGGTELATNIPRAVSDDGRFVFFHTGDALVPSDVNGKFDPYEYDSVTGEVSLLTSGSDPNDSYFMGSSDSGDDVFVITRERLSGWDTDGAYDIYDARADGGVAEPSPPAVECEGDSCQADPISPPATSEPGSNVYHGVGNPSAGRVAHHRCKQLRIRARKKRRLARRAHTRRARVIRREARGLTRRARACARRAGR